MSLSEKAQAEALTAIEEVRAALASTAPLDGVRRFQLRATLEYALAQVETIQPVKKARKALDTLPAQA